MDVAFIILTFAFINEASNRNSESNAQSNQDGTMGSDIKTANNQTILNRGNVNNNNDVAYTERNETTNYGSFILFGSIIIVVIVGITAFVLWSKNKNKKSNITSKQ
uniref:Syndecan domain-containing protein n=1 Tax=Strongyloides stercoralis TaxID=6248 RepID=A0A0K0ETA0_STRER